MDNLPDSPEVPFAQESAEPQPTQENSSQQIPNPESDIDHRARAIEEEFQHEAPNSEGFESSEKITSEQKPPSVSDTEAAVAVKPEPELTTRMEKLRQEAEVEDQRVAKDLSKEKKEASREQPQPLSPEEILKPQPVAGQAKTDTGSLQSHSNGQNLGLGHKAQIYMNQRQMERQR